MLRVCAFLAVLGVVASQTLLPDVDEFLPDCPARKLSPREAASLFRRDLRGKVVPFLLDTAVGLDKPNKTNGYTLGYNLEGPFRTSTRQLLSQARMLHTLCLLHNNVARRASERKALIRAADQGYDFMERYFYDSIFGGYVWEVSEDGEVLIAQKNAMGQLAVILAYVEYARAKDDVQFAERAQELYDNISRHIVDTKNGGFVQDFRADWKPINRPLGQGPTESYGLKTQSFPILFLEAMTELFVEVGRTNTEIAIEQLLDDELPQFFSKNPVNSVESFLRNGRVFSAGGALAYGTYLEYITARVNAEKAIGRDPNWKTFARYVQFVVDEGLSRGGVLQNDVLLWWASDNLIRALATVIENGRGDEYGKELRNVINFELCYLIDPLHGLSIWSVNSRGEPRNTLVLAPWKAALYEVRAKLTLVRAYLKN